MAQQTIGVGTVANDNTGDPIRDAFVKVNDNYNELYGSGIVDPVLSNLVTPGLEDTPTSANPNGITVSGDDADITVKANGTTGQIILDSPVTRVVSSLTTPGTNAGVAGDTVGDMRMDATTLYICVRNFDGSADAWLQSTTFVTF